MNESKEESPGRNGKDAIASSNDSTNIGEKKPKTSDDIMNILREMFREVLEEVLVVE